VLVKKETFNDSKIIVLETRSLTEKSLLDYQQKRCIPVHIANRFCMEVDFLLYGRKQTVIGFQNNAGGFELRGPYFKGNGSPKATSFLTMVRKSSMCLKVFLITCLIERCTSKKYQS